MMNIYKQLHKIPGIWRVLVSQLIARLPAGMLTLVLLLHMELKFHSYATGGIVLAAICIGQAITGPVTSRWLGRWGMRPVLLVTTLLHTATMTAIALVNSTISVYVALAFVLGVTVPPIASATRTIYPKMVPGKLLSGLYSLDASAQEIIWVAGPVVAVLMAIQTTPAIALLFIAGITIFGGILLITAPTVGSVTIPPARRKMGAVLGHKTVRLSTLVGFLYIASFAALEAGVVAIYGHEGAQGGLILGLNACGSLIGGVIVGHRALNRWSIPARMAIVLVGNALCLVSLDTLWLCFAAFVGGLGAAPTFAALASLVSSTVKFSETAEAFGWTATGQLVGAAIGAALAGYYIDQIGPRGAFLVALVSVTGAIVVALLGNRVVPNLQNKDASPIPDTEQISTIEPPRAIG
ncbi:MFS transporter [Canibacter sp. lx-72]|nr:MFS transporter [Canibacter zhuwentaonis]